MALRQQISHSRLTRATNHDIKGCKVVPVDQIYTSFLLFLRCLGQFCNQKLCVAFQNRFLILECTVTERMANEPPLTSVADIISSKQTRRVS